MILSNKTIITRVNLFLHSTRHVISTNPFDLFLPTYFDSSSIIFVIVSYFSCISCFTFVIRLL